MIRLTVCVPAEHAGRAVALGCALLERGCGERVLADGSAALDFWLPSADAAAAATRLERELEVDRLPARVERTLEEPGWSAAARRFHQPFEVAGRLWVRPPWEPPRAGRADVAIDPGMAFGTGQHATTRTCLELLAELPAGSLLDVGCGTGILAIAARRLGFEPVTAVDNDPLAVEATVANARANGVGLSAGVRVAGRDPLPSAETLLANIAALALERLPTSLTPPFPRRAVVSGLRPAQVGVVADTLASVGLQAVREVDAEGWASVLLEAG